MVGRMRSKRVGARIAKLVEEAIVDCYTEDEQHGSFLVMLEEHLRCPVRALVVGEDVTVVGFDWDQPGEIVARCRRDRRVHRVNVTALEWPGAPPQGAEWIEAYRAWMRGGLGADRSNASR